jgi:hypothetical protein
MPTTSAYDLEFLAADGTTWVPVMLARPRGEDGGVIEGAPVSIQEVLAASDADLQVSKRLIPVIQEDWSGGVGISYVEAPGVYTRTPGYACPAGAATAVTVHATNNSNSLIVAFEEYGSDLFIAQTGTGAANSGRIMRSVGGTGALSNSLNLGANEYVRDLLTFDDGTGTFLYASSCDATDPNPGANGRLHKWDGASWTSTAAGTFGTYSRQRLCKVYWVTEDGIGDWRLVTISGSKTISYTKPGADPMLAASWVEGVRIKSGANLLRLAAARRHVYVTAGDGVFDFDEQGNSPSLTGYSGRLIHGANGLAAQYLDGSVYSGLGQGLDRINVENQGVLQENVGQCGPGWGTRAENRWRGWTTELATDQGCVVDAIYNPSTQEAAIFWGKDRAIVGTETPNPLVWWGPEIVVTGGYKVSAMRSMAVANDDLRFFVAAWSSSTPILFWVSLPISGAPMQDMISGGKHRFATGTAVTVGSGTAQPYARIQLNDEGFGDENALKIVHKHGIKSRGLAGGTTKLTIEERADPAPGSTSWTSTTDITTSPQQSITPSSVVSGHTIERRISFVAPSGTATPPVVPVLQAVRSLAWRVVPSFGVRALPVEYGDGVLNRDNAHDDTFSPDDITASIAALIETGGRTTLRDPLDKRWTARLEQVLDRTETLGTDGPYGKTVRAILEIDILGAA